MNSQQPVRAFTDPIRGIAGPPVEFDRPDRATLADIIALVPIENEALRPHLRVKLGGVLIDPSLYHRVLPKRDAFLTVVLPVHGGDNLLGTIAAIALIGASLFVGGFGVPFLGAAFAAGTTGASLVAGGLSIAASLLLQGLQAPQQASRNTDANEIGVASAQNSFEPGAYLPRVFGTRKISPPMVMPPYTELDGNDQLVTAVYGLAGPHKIEKIKVGGADIEDAEDIEFEIREGFPADAPLTLVSDLRVEQPLNLKLSQFRVGVDDNSGGRVDTTRTPYNPLWHRVETRQSPDMARLFVTFDQGLLYLGSSEPTAAVTAIRLRLRRKGTTTWYNLPELVVRGQDASGALRLFIDLEWRSPGSMPGSVTAFSAGYGGWTWKYHTVERTASPAATYWTADGYFATNKIDWISPQQLRVYLSTATFPRDFYEIEVMRGLVVFDGQFVATSATVHALNAGFPIPSHYDFFTGLTYSGNLIVMADQGKFAHSILLPSLQSIWNEEPFDLDGQPTALLVIKARNRSMDQVSCLASGYTENWNGSSWVADQTTSNPSSWYRETLTSDYNAEPVPASLVDSANLQDWHEWCTANGYEVNAIVQGQPVTEVLSLVAQAGFARPRFAATHGVVIDRPRDPVGLITQRNASGFSFQKPFGRLPHALRVNLIDETADFQVREIVVYDDGFNADGSGGMLEAERFESVTYQSITAEAQAEARAKRDMRFAKHRSRLLNFSMDIEHLEFQLGDLVLVETDILGQIGGRGRVTSVTTSGGLVTGLLLDEQRDFTHADTNALPRAVAMRLADGTVRIERVTAADGDLDAVQFTTPFAMPTSGGDDLIFAGTMVATGTLGLEARRILIWDMAPGPELTCQITGIDYAEAEIYRLSRRSASFRGAGSLSVLPRRIAHCSVAFAGVGSLSAGYTSATDVAVSFAGAGGLSVSPKYSLNRSIAFDGVGQLAATPNHIQYRSVTMDGVGTLAASAGRLRLASVLMQGISALAVSSAVVRRGAVAFAGIGSLAALKQVTRKRMVAMAGVGSLAVTPVLVPGGPTLTQKGYGHVYGASTTANLVMSYANVDGGSAPAAGDLVVWIAGGADTVDNPINSLSGAGWTQSSTTYSTSLDFAMTLLAKEVTAGDLSSPATMIINPNSGSVGFWVAYSVSGAISSLAASALAVELSGSVAPSNQVQNSTGGSPAYAITFGVGGTSSGTPTLTMTGATADINFVTAANVWAANSWEDRIMIDLAAGGANITFSKADDGSANHMVSGYVTVN